MHQLDYASADDWNQSFTGPNSNWSERISTGPDVMAILGYPVLYSSKFKGHNILHNMVLSEGAVTDGEIVLTLTSL